MKFAFKDEGMSDSSGVKTSEGSCLVVLVNDSEPAA